MTTYRAYFRTDAEFAPSSARCRHPRAGACPRAASSIEEDHSLELCFQSYTAACRSTRSPSYARPQRTRGMARRRTCTCGLPRGDLLDALTDLVERDRAEAASCGFTDDEMSWLEDARRAIAKAKGGTQ